MHPDVSGPDEREVVEPADRAAWRTWLEARHADSAGIWLLFHRQASATDGVMRLRGDRYVLDHDRGVEAIGPYVSEILAVQTRGSKADVAAYIDKWVAWGEHNERISALVKRASVYRYSYEAGPWEPAPAGLEGDLGLGRG